MGLYVLVVSPIDDPSLASPPLVRGCPKLMVSFSANPCQPENAKAWGAICSNIDTQPCAQSFWGLEGGGGRGGGGVGGSAGQPLESPGGGGVGGYPNIHASK